LGTTPGRIVSTFAILETEEVTGRRFRSNASFVVDVPGQTIDRLELDVPLGCRDPIVTDGSTLYELPWSASSAEPRAGRRIELSTATEEPLPINLVPRVGFAVARSGRRIYLLGGENDEARRTVEVLKR
jgi:hypothetical protein